MKNKRIEKHINDNGALHTITFEKHLKPKTPPARKPGRPKFKWADKGIREYWETKQKAFTYSPMKDYDPDDLEQTNFIKTSPQLL